MVLARSSEPRSPVVRFHVKRAGRERRVAGPMSGQRAPTSAVDGTARCGRRCHGRQYRDAAGPPHDLPNPFVCQLRPPIKVSEPPRVDTGSSMPPSADSCGQGPTLGERGTTVFHVKPPAAGRLLDALVPTSLQGQNHAARPVPHGAAAGSPGGLHRSHHSHAVPVPIRQTQQETEQGSSAPQTHLRPHTLDVPCPQMLSTCQHRRSLVTTSRRLLASSTTCLCIHWGHTTALPHWSLSFSVHRNAQQNCPSGAANRPLQLM